MPLPTVEEPRGIQEDEKIHLDSHLNSLEINGYRCFERLTIEKLGRVNLIVGKNNVGKTALLEALRIYAGHGRADVLREILFDRNESSSDDSMSSEAISESSFAFKHLFHNRPEIADRHLPRRKQPYFTISEMGTDLLYLREKLFERGTDVDKFGEAFNNAIIKALGKKTTFVQSYFDTGLSWPSIDYLPASRESINNFFIKSKGLQNSKIVEFWDEITLTPSEDRVIDSLKILLPNLNRISMIAYPKSSKFRVAVARVEGQNEPVPLKSFGDGMNRLFGIVLALVNCKNGMLLVDEIETGFHYSVLPDVWNLIFNTARELDVQVFASTHSYDCIEAFAQAAQRDENSDGVLVRLAQSEKYIKAFTFDEKELETISKEKIEVR
jgi:AAA15 family ATPase/GTPase